MTGYTAASSLMALGGVILGTLVVVGYLIFIWWLDRYEREPIWLVALVFAYGGLGSTFLAVMLTAPLSVVGHALTGPDTGQIIDVVILAPFIEELTKGLIFLPLILNSNFDNETDGLIYGAAVGLGFAAVENLLYYTMVAPEGPGTLLAVVTMRTLFSSLVHCTSSAVLGMCIGYVRHRPGTGRWIFFILLGYSLAVLNHGMWNGLMTAASSAGDSPVGALGILLGISLVVGTGILMLIITQISLAREHSVIRRYLRDEASKGVLPAAHAEIIPYWLKRRRRGWLHPSVPLEPYLRATTLLAFRRHQLSISGGERRERYQRDIERLRQEVHRLLGGGPPRLILARAVLRAVPVKIASGSGESTR